MEVLTEPVVSFVVESFGKWVIEEAKLIKGVPQKVEGIERELKRMRCFLVDAVAAEGRGSRAQRSHNWVLEIQDIAYDAQDIVETYVLALVYSRGSPRRVKTLIRRYTTGLFNQLVLRRNIGMEIMSIKSRICEVRKSLATYGIRAVTEEEAFSMSNGSGGGGRGGGYQRRPLLWRQTFAHDIDQTHFVGLHEDVEKLVGILKDENHTSVCICGMGGLGKTTLTRKVYNHSDMKRAFDCFAWTSISQQFERNAVWQEILSQLPSKDSGDLGNMTESQLVEELHHILQNEKCLVVIDDIWLTDHWDLLKPALWPINSGMTGTKMLLTSRNKSMASHLGAYYHEPRVLNDDQAWQLVQRKAFSNTNLTDPSYDKKVELGREMVKHCGGLPLGLVVLAGILATKAEIWEWEVVQKNVSSRINRGEGIGQENNCGVRPVLELSYNELPHQLKPCFLCLGNFREDSEIGAEELYHMWIAEGMVLKDDKAEGETMMEVAERYLNELAQRCMVQVKLAADIFSGKFESCTLHDLMRQLCLSKAGQENFLQQVVGSHLESNVSKARRLAVHLGDVERKKANYKGKLDFGEDRKKIRSLLLYFGGHDGSLKSRYLQSFRALRILHLSNVYFHRKTLKAIRNLIHLRWLRLRYCSGARFPSSLSNLKCLQILDLRKNTSAWVPDVLWKMRSLRHLYLGNSLLRSSRKQSEKYLRRETWRLDGLSELETLQFNRRNYVDVEDLLKLTSLRKLEADVEWREFNGIVKSLSGSGSQLRHSSLQVWNLSGLIEDSSELLGLLTCHHLNKLQIRGSIEKLPKHQNLSPNLTYLHLNNSFLKEDPMPTLRELPELRFLWLEKGYEGREMVCSGMGFPKLKRLRLVYLTSLKEWRVDEGAMPSLSSLQIRYCWRLVMLPDGLRLLTTLQELRIGGMPQTFRRRLQVADGVEGPDVYKVKHVPSLVIA